MSASDLNFADILQCQGQYQVRLDPPFTPGMSVAGTVVEVGPECDLQIGDRVLGMTASGWGGYAEEALVRGHEMRIVPDNVSLPAAAAMNVIYGTGWTGRLARAMQPGEKSACFGGGWSWLRGSNGESSWMYRHRRRRWKRES